MEPFSVPDSNDNAGGGVLHRWGKIYSHSDIYIYIISENRNLGIARKKENSNKFWFW